MRILDSEGTELRDPDLEAGHLVSETIVARHHDAVPEVPRVTERVLVDQADTGSLYKVVTVQERVPAKPAWDETEEIYRYVPYTEEELTELAAAKAAEEARVAAEEAAAAEKAANDEVMRALPAAVAELAVAVAALSEERSM